MISRSSTALSRLRLLPALLFLSAFSAGVSAQHAANIVFATGAASVVAADGSVRRAERGGAIAAGETVDTADGRAQLRFLDGSAISLQPQTQFRVEQFRFADQGGRAAEEDRIVMRFVKGALRAVSGLIGRERREQYRMDTVVGTIGIRGTEYGATLGGGGLAVSVYAGVVEVCNNAGCAQGGPGQVLLVPDAGTRPQLQPGGAPPTASPATPTAPELPPVQPATQPSAPAQPEPPVQPPTYNPNTGGYYH